MTLALLTAPALSQSTSPLSRDDIIVSSWQIIAGIVSAIVAGGLVGVGGVILLVRRLRQDDVLKDAIEKLATSLPQDTLLTIRHLVGAIEELAALAREVTDGQPNLPSDGHAQD